MSDSLNIKSRRTADEPIYLNEDLYGEPKERFKFFSNLIAKENRPAGTTLLDIGCATGGLLYHLQNEFPDLELHGADVSQAMIDQASEAMPKIAFHKCSILDDAFFAERSFDIVICQGVLPIIDNMAQAVTNLATAVKPGGSLYIFNSMNETPVDVIVRYRPFDAGREDWEIGRNLWSMAAVEAAVRDAAPDMSIEWHAFEIPFDIPRQDDPIRTWTIDTSDKPRQLINGACQLVNIKCIEAHRPAAD